MVFGPVPDQLSSFTYLAGLPIWKCGEKRFVFVIFPESLGANPWPTDLPSFNTMDCSLRGLYDDRPTSLLECLDEGSARSRRRGSSRGGGIGGDARAAPSRRCNRSRRRSSRSSRRRPRAPRPVKAGLLKEHVAQIYPLRSNFDGDSSGD